MGIVMAIGLIDEYMINKPVLIGTDSQVVLKALQKGKLTIGGYIMDHIHKRVTRLLKKRENCQDSIESSNWGLTLDQSPAT